MAVDRWITGLVGVAVVSAMLYFDLWHALLIGVSLALVWECIHVVPCGWLRIGSVICVLLALACLWQAPWILLLLAWFNDTGAYVVGCSVGGRKLCPKISPAKTWSGLVGGLFCGMGGIWLLSTSAYGAVVPKWSLSTWFFLSVSGHLGDLAESWVKRRIGIKDTGNYLPGHGGFLDRCDSILGMGLAYGVLKVLGF